MNYPYALSDLKTYKCLKPNYNRKE